MFRIYIIICLLLRITTGSAQQLYFTNYNEGTGLSQEQVLSVCQAANGVMWLGTNGGGITCFDGKYYNYFTIKNGLADNVVYSIVRASNDDLLIGTNEGLSVYSKGKFTNYTTNNGLTHNRIFAIYPYKQGYVLATARGLCFYNNNKIQPLPINVALDTAQVFCIAQQHNGNYWYGTLGSGAFEVKKNNSVTQYNSTNSELDDEIYGIAEYNSEVYLGSNHLLYKQTAHGFKKVFPNVSSKDLVPYNQLFVDSKNTLWIGSAMGLYNLKGSVYVRYTKKDGLTDDAIWKIYEDKEHNMWLGSDISGLSKYRGEKLITYNKNSGIIANSVSAIYKAGKKLHLGTVEGLSIIEGKSITNYDRSIWKSNTLVYAIKEYNNQLLIGTTFGLQVLKKEKFSKIEYKGTNTSWNTIFDVLINTDDKIIVATDAGIAVVNNNTTVPLEGIDKKVKLCRSIYQDTKGVYWIGTDDGLYSFDGKHTTYYPAKQGCTTKSIQHVTGQGNSVYMATGDGVYVYNGKNFTHITEQQGLSNNDVYSVATDKAGNIWAGTPNALDKITLNKNGTYSIKHIDITECMNKALFIDENNHVYVGTQKGLVVYKPEYDVPNKLAPQLLIRSIDMFSTPVNWRAEAEVDSVDYQGLPVNLSLPYNKNYLTFHYVGVSHTTPTKVRYQYMLKGLDETWLPITNKVDVAYDNLPFGEYEFLLKAENGEGVWNATPLSYKFEIRPPFWRTWWAYSLLAGIVVSLLYSYFSIRRASSKIDEQNKIIAEKNRNITDSINYAKRIQQGFLASKAALNAAVPQHFVLFKPKDIVSGDFYWCESLPDRTLIACADSTGHGIPGAFMSLIGINVLNECFFSKKMYVPATMLDELRRVIILALNPNQDMEGGKDGMDMTFLSIPKQPNAEGKFIIDFAGAQNSLYVVDGVTKQLIEHKTDKQPVAFYPHMKPFTSYQITVNKGDTLYMTTDGYPDQFGGEKEKKFMYKKLKELLALNTHLTMEEQHHALHIAFDNWQGAQDQVDDVTVMGIKL